MPRQKKSTTTNITPVRRPRRAAVGASKKAEMPAVSQDRVSSSTGSAGALVSIILLVVVVVGLLGGGYYWFTQQSKDKKSDADTAFQNYQIPLGVNVPAQQEDAPPQIALQKYQDDVAHFSFEYPQDWAISATSTVGDKRIVTLGTASTSMSIITTRTSKPLSEYVTTLDTASKTANAGKPSTTIEESHDVTVNGIPAIARLQRLLAGDKQQAITYFGLKDYVVSAAITDATIATSTLSLYEQIVNSFALVSTSTAPAVATSTIATSTATSTQNVR